MKRILCAAFAVLVVLLLTAAHASAAVGPAYTQAQLDQMLAPVALYPDPLLSQVLMASTYPLEVVEAARWTRAHPGLHGDAATRAVADRDWDPSVKSLVAFPRVLERMDQNIDWTRTLGDAFLAQEPQVMDTVQGLRRRARAAGNLQSDDRLRVEAQGDAIAVLPASPAYFYVPYYDPVVVYGPWWWPGYPPVAWAPWPGYVRVHRPGLSFAFWWGPPIGLAADFFFGNCDWSRHSVRVVNVHAYYYRPPQFAGDGRGHWRHDPRHRRNVAYATPELGRRFGAAHDAPRGAPHPEVRRTAPPAPAATPSHGWPHASTQLQPPAHAGHGVRTETLPGAAARPAPHPQRPTALTTQPPVRTIQHGRRPPQAHARPPTHEPAPRARGAPDNGVAGNPPNHGRHGRGAERGS